MWWLGGHLRCDSVARQGLITISCLELKAEVVTSEVSCFIEKAKRVTLKWISEWVVVVRIFFLVVARRRKDAKQHGKEREMIHC
jgi:hypothetical protein